MYYSELSSLYENQNYMNLISKENYDLSIFGCKYHFNQTFQIVTNHIHNLILCSLKISGFWGQVTHLNGNLPWPLIWIKIIQHQILVRKSEN